jgi:hypothetical protein
MKNKSTAIITTTIGILLAFAGFEHGLFEVLQGYKPTGSNFISAIGKEMQWWVHGSEDAFTLIPNYLITGIFAMCVSIIIVIWSIFCLHKKKSITIFLLLFILLVLVGGGIGFIPFFIVTWAYATRMNKPLNQWKRWLKPKMRNNIAFLWTYALAATAICWLIAIEIAIFGYVPGVNNSDFKLGICWSFLFIALLLLNVSYISGFAYDIDRQLSEE